MNMSKNNNTMIISLNDEYRKFLKSILDDEENEIYDEVVTVILKSWDSKVSEISESIASIVGADVEEKKSRKGRKTTGPKRPMSAYLYFCKEKRAEVKEENPNMKATEITSELGRLWHEVKETEEVEQYNELAKADRARYNAEVPKEEKEEKPKKKKKAQVESDDGENKEEKPKKKRVTKKGGPKRPKSAYLYFCEEKRAEVKEENPEMKPTEVTSELGRLWNKIKDTKAALKYKEQAEDAKAQYAEVVASGDGEEEPVFATKKSKKLPKAKDEKVPKTGYQLFCKESDETDKKELKRQWLEMKKNDVERFQEYNIRAAEMKLQSESEEPEGEEEVEAKTTEPEAKTTEPEAKTTEPEAKTTEPEAKTTEPETDCQIPLSTLIYEDDEEEEDPALVDTTALLEYLEQNETLEKSDFMDQAESLENLPSEIKESITKVKKLKTKTLKSPVLEKLMKLCKDTIKSYQL